MRRLRPSQLDTTGATTGQVVTVGANGKADWQDGTGGAPAGGDPSWTYPTYQNGWVTFSASPAPGNPASYFPARFRKDANGFVHLSGVIKSGTVGSAAFTLPAGYRPAGRLVLVTISNAAAGAIDVTTAGAVIPNAPSTASWVSLDGLTFLGEQ